MKKSNRVYAIGVLTFAFALGARNASAQSDDHKADARAAYDGAALAHDRGDFLVAAREFARADLLQPNDVALALALESATRAGSAALGMNLVERAHDREVIDPNVQARADEATTALAPRASKIIITCEACETEVDGVPAMRVFWVEPGTHVVEMTRGTQVDRMEIHAVAGATFEATPPPVAVVAPPPDTQKIETPPPEVITVEKPAPKHGWSPAVFFGAAGVTAIAGGLTVWSAVDMYNQHASFQAHPTSNAANAGDTAQTRTNVFLGVTAIAAVSTAVIGLVLVDWSSPKNSTDVGVAISPSSITLGGHFQ